jgi:guanylate kinase
LGSRAAAGQAAFEVRLSAAEMSHWPEYDCVIVNSDIEDSVGLVQAIVTAERLRRTRQVGLADFVNRLRAG